MIYVVLTVIATGLALLIRNQEYALPCRDGGYGPGRFRPRNREQARNDVLEMAIYLLMAGVSACRIAVGNDYWVYRDNFKLIAQGRHVASEPGFNLVVKGFVEIFGYDKYLPIFGFFSLVTVFFLVRALHDQGRHFAFSLFLLFTEGFYFNSLNTVRYYLALAMALFAMKYVLRGKWPEFLIFVLAGALFHKSILLILPVYAVAYYLASVRLKKWHGIVIGLFLASLLFGRDLYRKVIFAIYPFYENSQFDQSRIPYKNLALCLGTLALCLIVWYSRERKTGKLEIRDLEAWNAEKRKSDVLNLEAGYSENQNSDLRALRFYGILNLFALIAFCCGGFIPEVSRIGYYMMIAQVFLIPELLERIPQKRLRWLCTAGCVGAFALHFALLLRQMYLVDVRLLPYLNWIFN